MESDGVYLATARIQGVQINHGGDVLVDVRLPLADIQSVLMHFYALKHDRLWGKERKKRKEKHQLEQ